MNGKLTVVERAVVWRARQRQLRDQRELLEARKAQIDTDLAAQVAALDAEIRQYITETLKVHQELVLPGLAHAPVFCAYARPRLTEERSPDEAVQTMQGMLAAPLPAASLGEVGQHRHE